VCHAPFSGPLLQVWSLKLRSKRQLFVRTIFLIWSITSWWNKNNFDEVKSQVHCLGHNFFVIEDLDVLMKRHAHMYHNFTVCHKRLEYRWWIVTYSNKVTVTIFSYSLIQGWFWAYSDYVRSGHPSVIQRFKFAKIKGPAQKGVKFGEFLKISWTGSPNILIFYIHH